MSDDAPWLGLSNERGEQFMVNPRGAWRILAQTEVDNDIVMQIENFSTGERSSLMATRIDD